MNEVVLYYDSGFEALDYGPGHPMRGDRYPRAMSEFQRRGVLDKLSVRVPEIISDDILTLFHTPEYVESVKEVSAAGRGDLGAEVPGFPGIYEVARLSVSATIAGAGALADDKADIAINICGGWHHAFADQGRGFCIFNDIAVAANYLTRRKGIKKIMILDYDAHHGDGTQKAFYDNPDIYTISCHQDPGTLYPFLTGFEGERGSGPGEGFNRNFPLPAGSGDEEFISRFNEVPDLFREFQPELLILQMGVDGSRECVIASLNLSERAYDYASRKIMELKEELGFKLLALGGGGFVHPMLGRNWGIQIQNFSDP
ncbi:MAG: acetoin utilization protein AcuC [Candidatus Auribacterota bacterium]|nr:acetoin utilization protein AcuC [Candidatus Auribacterota bacterium]